MISTMSIIFPPTRLWSQTNGDGHILPLNIELSSFLKLYFIGQCWTTNGTIQNRIYSSPSVFWRIKNLTVQLETQWILRLDSVGGKHYLFIPLVHHDGSLSNVMTILVLEFALGDISLIQLLHSLLHPFCQLLTWSEKWTRMVRKLSPWGSILNLGYGKLHFGSWLSLPFKCYCHSQPFNFPCMIKPRSRYTEELIRSSSGLELE